MNLITVDNPEIYAVSVSQSPGFLAPAINAHIMPNDAQAQASWFDYNAPLLNISVGGTPYRCLPQEISVEIDPDNRGVGIEVQYYPEILVLLQNTGLRKHLVFLSCSSHEQELLEDEYDDDHYEVLFQSCDVYCSNGWTIQGIMAEVCSRIGLTVNMDVPTFHVPNPTVILQKGQTVLSFIKSLLPGGFEYLWNIENSQLTISLIQPHTQAISFLPGVSRMAVVKSGVPAYDFAEIQGGEYKKGINATLGGAGWKPITSTSSQAGQVREETLPQKTTETETYDVTRTYKTGTDGETLFAVLSQITIVTETGSGTMLRRTEETFAYENLDPMTYVQPRQTRVTKTHQRPYIIVSLGQAVMGANTAYLTNDNRVLLKAEYDELESEAQPDILVSASHGFGEAETEEETFSWVQVNDADKNSHEGMQTANTHTRRQRFVTIEGRAYDALRSPQEVLQQALSDLATKQTEVDVSSIGNDVWLTAESLVQTFQWLSPGAFQSETARTVFDPKLNGTVSNTSTIGLNGTPPGSPSKYRTERLKATLERNNTVEGWSGGDETCIPFYGSIETNNPQDFQVWAGLLWRQVSTPRRRVVMSSFDQLLPMGSFVGGVYMTSFQCSQSEDGAQTVEMGGI